MKNDDFKIDLEGKCLDSVRACKKYEFDSAANRVSLSKVFDYIVFGTHIDLDDIPF